MSLPALPKSKLHELLKKYDLDEKDVYIDDNNLPWFTHQLLADLMGVTLPTITNNVREFFDWEILEKDKNLKKFKISSDSYSKNYYSLDILTQLGISLKSKPAREFQKQLRNLFKGLVKGDLTIIDTKSIFNAIASQPTTTHRQKINEQMINQGLLEADIETRCYNVKLNKTLTDLIKSEGLGGLIPHVQRRMGKAIYKMYPQEWDAINGITNPHTRRDHCTADQWMVTQFIEKELYKMIINHDGVISTRLLLRFADDCTQRGLGLWELMQDNEQIKGKINNQQCSLDSYWRV